MEQGFNYVYVLSGVAMMALVTYIPRMIPLTFMRRKITNRFVKSFLYYTPYDNFGEIYWDNGEIAHYVKYIIKNNYNIDKIKHSKWILVRNIIIPIVVITIFILLYFIFKNLLANKILLSVKYS